jgi:hypothetical protein
MPIDVQKDDWVMIPGFPMYRINRGGGIQSKYHGPWRDIKPAIRNRYPAVSIHDETGKAKNRYVHRLVMESFVGPRPEGMQCRHLDGNPLNCNLENLAWGTPKENSNDKVAHGTVVMGGRIAWARCTEKDVDDMRRMRMDGATRNEIAAKYQITPAHVTKVILGGYGMWKHVPPESREELKQAGYETIRRMRTGKKHSAETCQKIRMARLASRRSA